MVRSFSLPKFACFIAGLCWLGASSAAPVRAADVDMSVLLTNWVGEALSPLEEKQAIGLASWNTATPTG